MTDSEGEGKEATVSPEEIREVDRWMYQFTAQLAHDMRAPMGAIFMWAHVLRAADGGENAAAIEAIEASARQQSRMLADVVDMARALVGRLPVDRAPADLRDLVTAALDERNKDASARRVTLEWQRDGQADAGALVVKSDAKRLQQALGCLLGYGIANTPAGGRVALWLRGAAPEGEAEVGVRLSGAGVDAAEVDDLFVPYRAQGLDLTAARPDFGMGLAFARAVARLHGGSLDVENQGPGGAMAFVVRLPLAARA